MKKIAIPISIVLMKDKSEHRVNRSLGDKIQTTLAEAEQHLFIQLPELGLTINSAEIKEVKNTTRDGYEEERESEPSESQLEKADQKREEVGKELKAKGVI